MSRRRPGIRFLGAESEAQVPWPGGRLWKPDQSESVGIAFGQTLSPRKTRRIRVVVFGWCFVVFAKKFKCQ
jgi:hypothetical protein